MNFKYVMFTDGTRDLPIIFPNALSHVGVSEMFISHEEGKGFKPISAGFVDTEILTCHGESESLQLKSRPEDYDIIELYPWCFGMNDPYTTALIRKTIKDRKNG